MEYTNKRTDELWRWSATDLAHGIRTGLISSREAVSSCLNRIEEVNPALNALVEVHAEEALAAADQADLAVKKGEVLKPLHGVPVSTKVNVDQAGHATTDGVLAFKDQIAEKDSPPVANLRKAGAVIVGRSNTPAFSFRWFTNNDLHGRTLNPWDKTRTPGGSSGGASSAVASGMMPIGHGNDIGGSVRHPAYACGIAGIRPTMGRIPGWYGPPSGDQSPSTQLMSTDGPLARNVADLRLAFSCMSEFDPRDPLHTSVPLLGEPLQKPIRVGLLRDVGVAKPSPAVNQALNDAASQLEEAGYIVEEVHLPLFAEAYRLWYLLVLEDFRTALPLVEQYGDEGMKKAAFHYFSNAKEWWGEEPKLSDYIKGYSRRGTLIVQLQEFLQEYPILLMPVSTDQAFEQDADLVSVESMRRCMDAQWSMMAIPVLGFPAMSVPTAVVDDLPVGVQLLGRRFREDTLFDAAEVIEAHAKIQTPIDPR
ncbi:amidase family protein [Halalkalibacter krulwichiae]|uniref:Glutamyl-tRNA(Gln) amidotransferase subunit A n=1 Tax=Halalkalibacter krulwichiae TaxID=199441 RepID=A0A1X9M933_9BACI|nr:amidase family protein [Halalkalibacter krulwichiae]ARK29897.1 Glutamyl-tRNA(Gln) amidotransferase subunit A [Halalkalibacter krulwichiae]